MDKKAEGVLKERERIMQRFVEVYDDLVENSGRGIQDHIAPLADIISGYSGGNTLNTESGIVDMSGEAARQLFRLIGLDVKTVKQFSQHPEVQVAMAQAMLLDSGKGDERIVARGVQRAIGTNAPMYNAFLTRDHLPVLNSQVLTALRDNLPETTLVHKADIRDRRMMLRLTDESWYHDLGNKDPALTAIVVDNDERGRGGLSIRTGVTRKACWNYTLDHQPVFHHASGFIHPMQLNDGINDAIGRLDTVATAVSTRLREFHDVTVADVQGMLQLMAGEMGLPKYATDASYQWWEDAGAANTLFMVVQALAFGAGAMSDRKKPQWARREEVEYQTYAMADVYANTGVLQFHECPRCHRPINVDLDEGVVEGEFTVE